MEDGLIRRVSNLLEAQVGYDMVGLEPEQGRCFGFNETAACVWQMLERPLTRISLRDALLDRFEVEKEHCEKLLEKLLNDLEAKGLIQSA